MAPGPIPPGVVWRPSHYQADRVGAGARVGQAGADRQVGERADAVLAAVEAVARRERLAVGAEPLAVGQALAQQAMTAGKQIEEAILLFN